MVFSSEALTKIRNYSWPGNSRGLTAEGVNLPRILDETELEYIKKALVLAEGNQTKVEKLLSLGAKTLIKRLEKFPELKLLANQRKKQ